MGREIGPKERAMRELREQQASDFSKRKPKPKPMPKPKPKRSRGRGSR